MVRRDLPMTREVYISLAFEQPESELGAEELAEIPEMFASDMPDETPSEASDKSDAMPLRDAKVPARKLSLAP